VGEEQTGPDKDLFLPVDILQNHPELVQILEIFIYLFGKYRDFTYRKDNNPNGQLQSTTPIYLRGK
jgi:hypothetical protein